MKLYLSVNKPAINGYICIDLATQTIDFNNLNPICEPAECTEMIFDEVLSYIDLQQVPNVLTKLFTRLRKGGKIIITNFDINEIIKSYQNGLLSIADLNFVLFGADRIKKTNCISHIDIERIIVNSGLSLSSIDLTAGKFTIVAQRN